MTTATRTRSKPDTKSRKAPDSRVSPVLAPAIPSAESKDVVIGFRIPARWKANIERRLLALGVPENKFSDFYRGAVIAGVGNALRAQDPDWQKFIAAIQPKAQEMLGMDLMDDGITGIIEEGLEIAKK